MISNRFKHLLSSLVWALISTKPTRPRPLLTPLQCVAPVERQAFTISSMQPRSIQRHEHRIIKQMTQVIVLVVRGGVWGSENRLSDSSTGLNIMCIFCIHHQFDSQYSVFGLSIRLDVVYYSGVIQVLLLLRRQFLVVDSLITVMIITYI